MISALKLVCTQMYEKKQNFYGSSVWLAHYGKHGGFDGADWFKHLQNILLWKSFEWGGVAVTFHSNVGYRMN